MKTESFVSNYLKKEDLANGPVRIQIDSVTQDKLGDDIKLVVHASDTSVPSVALNKTNIQKLWKILGSKETDDWIGYTIEVYVDPSVMYQGKKVGGLAVRGVKNAQRNTEAAKPGAKRAADPI